MRQPAFRTATAPLLLLLLGTASPAAELAGRPCQPIASSSEPPRVRCEDTGDEFFFTNAPLRHPNASAWICSTVQARTTNEVTDTNEQGQLRTVSTETREERDHRTQTEDLLKAARGLEPSCWRTEEIGVDNPRARAEAERIRRQQEKEEAERLRKEEEARIAEQKKRDRILRPHRKRPSNAAEMLIRATTPPRLNDGTGPERMDACIAVDLSGSMGPVFRHLSSQFGRIAEAWNHHYPEGVRITVVGFGQGSAKDPYREFQLLQGATLADFQKFLRGDPTRDDAGTEPTIDAVRSCSERVRTSTKSTSAERKQVVLLSDESGDRVAGTPNPWEVLGEMRAEGVQFSWINPREYGRCPEVLSTQLSEPALESNYRKIVQSELIHTCGTSAVAHLLWKERGSMEMVRLLERVLDTPPSQLWNRAGAEPTDLIASLYSSLPAHPPTIDAINRRIDVHFEYLNGLYEERVEMTSETRRFYLWLLLQQMDRNIDGIQADLDSIHRNLEGVQRDLETRDAKSKKAPFFNPIDWF